MDIPLQQTKLTLPPARPRLVERPRLLARLDGLRSGEARLALVCASAGSGKTTLAVQWLGGVDWPVAWLALDEGDNLPGRFFAYLAAALQAAAPGAGRQALELLELPGWRPEEVVTLLSNDLARATMPFILALDDLHNITNPLLLRALALLVEAQPPQMRLVLLSRQDPLIPLARLRAGGELVEIRQEDLRFSLPESLAFLNQGMGLQLTGEQTQALEARTEGWIAGLQMAALSLQRAPDIERFIQDFSGSHRFILDYLVEEVLAGQPQGVQSFLLQTSVLEQMCAGLCAALSGQTAGEAQALLEELARANLFIIPLDEQRRWYRYHHLFRDLLRARLGLTGDPAQTAALRQRASNWYEANGDPRLAVEYTLQAGDAERAADLIESNIRQRWQTVDMEFHLLLERLPFEVVMRRPALCLQSAWLCVIRGQAERVLPFVEAAESALDAPGRPPAASDAAQRAFARALRAYLADLENRPAALDESLALALEAIPADNPGMRNSVAVVLGTIHYMEGDFPAALRYYEDALALDQRVNGTNAVPIAAMRIALLLLAQGNLHEAARRLEQAEAYVRQRGSRRFYISGALNLLRGQILLEWNRLEEAGEQIRDGLRLLEDWPSPQVRSLGLALQARLLIATGDLAGAGAALAAAGDLQSQARSHPIFVEAVEQGRVALLIAGQDWEALEDWARRTETQLPPELRFRFEARRIELCRAWLALGRSAQAAAVLGDLAAAAGERNGRRLAILILLAAARAGEADPAPALAALDEALRLAEPQGYLRSFIDAGQALRPLLRAWLRLEGPSGEARLRQYAGRILAACETAAPPGLLPLTQAPELIEPLSPREQEVLLLLAVGLTNAQIAARLVISPRTAKKHAENIYRKLGVQNRTQAVARARELGLLA